MTRQLSQTPAAIKARAWYAKNTLRHAAIQRKWRQKNRLQSNTYYRQYMRNNPERALLYAARKRANRSGLECTISQADIVIPARCPVFGFPLRWAVGRATEGSPTLDRINNARGYIPGNVMVVSARANRLKSDATPEELHLIAKFYSNI